MAFESFEEVTGVDVLEGVVGVMLEELLAGFGVADAAENAKLEEVEIADRRALVGPS